MVVWVEVSHDDLELPVAIADTARDLARISGAKLSTVKSSASRAKTGHANRWCPYRRVMIDED